jgi:hypothetical protein
VNSRRPQTGLRWKELELRRTLQLRQSSQFTKAVKLTVLVFGSQVLVDHHNIHISSTCLSPNARKLVRSHATHARIGRAVVGFFVHSRSFRAPLCARLLFELGEQRILLASYEGDAISIAPEDQKLSFSPRSYLLRLFQVCSSNSQSSDPLIV